MSTKLLVNPGYCWVLLTSWKILAAHTQDMRLSVSYELTRQNKGLRFHTALPGDNCSLGQDQHCPGHLFSRVLPPPDGNRLEGLSALT